MAQHVDRKSVYKSTGAKPGPKPSRQKIAIKLPSDILKEQIVSTLQMAITNNRPPTPEELIESAQAAMGVVMISISDLKDADQMSTIVARVIRASTDIIRCQKDIDASLTDEELLKSIPDDILNKIDKSVKEAVRLSERS